MIKVNLLKNRGGGGRSGTTVTETQFDDSFDVGFDDSAKDQGGPLNKILLMLIWVVGLYVYEWYNIGNLTQQNTQLQAQIAKLDQEVGAIKPQIESAKKLQSANQELTKKLGLVRELGRLRLREIRAIDHLQNVIPERVFFSNIKFTDTTFEVTGQSANDQDLDRLLEGMRQNAVFVDVLLARSVEQKGPQGNTKSFLITSGLGKDF